MNYRKVVNHNVFFFFSGITSKKILKTEEEITDIVDFLYCFLFFFFF